MKLQNLQAYYKLQGVEKGDTVVIYLPMIDGFFYAVYLANNQFGLGFVIPDAAWVTGVLRQTLEDNLDLLVLNCIKIWPGICTEL